MRCVQGFHTYPVGGNEEPLVWVGAPDGYDPTTGAVKESAAYQTSWYTQEDFYNSPITSPPYGPNLPCAESESGIL